jgi:hypothetical protein
VAWAAACTPKIGNCFRVRIPIWVRNDGLARSTWVGAMVPFSGRCRDAIAAIPRSGLKIATDNT